jgi:hypothetical protein
MSQFKKASRRADSFEEHVHKLPDGSLTKGSLHKPTKDQFDMHTHLYEFNEDIAETEPMHNFGDHTHMTKYGESSGPMKPQKMPGEPWKKMDSLQREGVDYVLRSETGHVIGKGKTAAEACRHYDAFDADETHAKASFSHAIGEDVDEAKWEHAKKASTKAVGAVKWPLVQHIYQQMHGDCP